LLFIFEVQGKEGNRLPAPVMPQQMQGVPQIQVSGYAVEVSVKHLVCQINKEEGYPPYNIVRSNRPDRILEDLALVRDCVRKVQQKFSVYKGGNIPRVLTPIALAFQGQFNLLICRKWQTGETDTLLEFSLPWIAQDEIFGYFNLYSITKCLDSVKLLDETFENKKF
jgi:hypothetical protein